MKRNCSNKYNSKGVMALEALLGTILSVVALVMIFYVFSNAFLQTNDNHKIAEQNAKSMKEFIDYFSQGEFKDYSNCYGMLKLENLENFQGPDKDNVYKYIIKKDGIYLINKNIINAIDGGSKKNKYIIDLKKPQVKFENEIEIYLDETDSGSIFSAYGSGSYDEKIKLSKKLNYVILEPDYGFFDKSSVGYNQNKYIITYFKDVARNEYDINSVVEDNMYGELGGRYLAYNNNRNILFIVNEEISETLLFYDLCSLKQLNENTRHFFYEKRNGRNLDYINNIIIYRFKKDDGNYHDISYKWENGPICLLKDEEVDCKNYLYGDYDTYDDFIIAMENFALFETDADLHNVKLDISFEELKLKDIQKNNYKFYLDNMFNNVFIPITDKEMNPINLNTLTNKEKKELGFYDIAEWGGMNNRVFNGCEEKLCNNIYYKDKRFYFYLKSDNIIKSWSKQTEIVNPGFFTFKENFLRKQYDSNGNYKLYFNGKEVNFIEKIEVDEYGVGLDDNRYVYHINLDFDLEPKKNDNGQLEKRKVNYDIILSSIQYRQIPEFKR